MTDIIKYGNSAIQELDDLKRISRQVKDRTNNGLVIVTTALDNTTDRIAEALYFGNHRNAEQIFGVYRSLIEQIGDAQLTRFAGSVYQQFNTQQFLAGRSRNIDEMQLASGERLTAHLLHAYLKQSGIYSALVDTIDADFPLRLNLGRKPTAATIDMESSREVARKLKSKYGVIIVPGYVGKGLDGLVRTLGRGGSDTAAFAYAYAFDANQVWIVAEDALTTAPLESARVVEEINLNEAWDAGFFGARLKTHKSIEPLEMFLSEHPNSYVYITGKEMEPRKTRINPQAKEQTVRFIASGIIRRYGMRGDWRGFLNQLYSNSAVDWFLLGGMVGELGMGVSERGWELADAMIKESEKRGYIEITHHDNVAYIGVVGSGMSDKKGTANRAYRSLRGVNILRAHDPNVREPSSTSIGIMVDPRYERQAVESLHREFFQNGNGRRR